MKVINGHRLPIPDECPHFLAEVVRHVFEAEPADRPDFGEIVRDLRAKDPMGIAVDDYAGSSDSVDNYASPADNYANPHNNYATHPTSNSSDHHGHNYANHPNYQTSEEI